MSDLEHLVHDLVARVDALERENRALRSSAIPAQHAEDILPATASTLERLSRRWVLRRGMQAAAASVAAGVLLQRDASSALAGADNFDHINANSIEIYRIAGDKSSLVVRGQAVDHPVTYSVNEGGGTAVWARTTGGNASAVFAESSGMGVEGVGVVGVHGTAQTTDQPGVYGTHAGTGPGVWGDGQGNDRAGERGRNSNGFGVLGEGRIGVQGKSGTDNWTAVVGEHTGAVGYGVVGIGKGAGVGVTGRNNAANGVGVKGEASANVGVLGEGMVGVKGTSSTANYTGVVGEHTGSVGYGVLGVGKGTGVGVTGRNPTGDGVRGEGKTGVNGASTSTNGSGVNGTGNATDGFGVKGTGSVGVGAFSSTHGFEAVYAVHTGDYGFGVVGVGQGAGAGLFGQNPDGDGVYGEGKFGLRVKSTATGGYGAVIEGGKAQLRLVPNTTAGKPTSGSHLKGELVMDKNAVLWVCTVSGTPGTWRKVSTTAS